MVMLKDFEWTVQLRLAAALALGLLVGLERERRRAESHNVLPAGARTFTITSLFGFACAWLHQNGVAAALPVGMVAVTALCVTGYLSKLREGRVGWTSEVAVLLTFSVGALALLSQMWIAATLGIVNTLLLSEKTEIESSIEFLDRAEFLAVLKFLIVTLIILPALPDQAFMPFPAHPLFQLNPRTIWRVVVLVSSVGFVGYLLMRLCGAQVGLWLSGLLGGIVSSTAVALSMGRVARQMPAQAEDALRASLLASGMTYLRLAVLVAIIAPQWLPELWVPLVVLSSGGLLATIGLVHTRGAQVPGTAHVSHNPFELRFALAFAALFVVLSIGTQAAASRLGAESLYAIAALTGVTDITPLVMSLVMRPEVVHSMATAIIVALMTNTLAKGIYFASVSGTVRLQTYVRCGVWAALHIPFLWWR